MLNVLSPGNNSSCAAYITTQNNTVLGLGLRLGLRIGLVLGLGLRIGLVLGLGLRLGLRIGWISAGIRIGLSH
jgi:hypothetical protein